MVWMLNTIWQVLALCLSVWIAMKHFRHLRRLGPSKGSTIGDCFRVLIKSRVLYFASSARVSFVYVSCLQFDSLPPELNHSKPTGVQILNGAFQILLAMQMFVLGPRLILSVREYHAKLVANSDAEIIRLYAYIANEHGNEMSVPPMRLQIKSISKTQTVIFWYPYLDQMHELYHAKQKKNQEVVVKPQMVECVRSGENAYPPSSSISVA
ncbi:hypothetical protein DFJ58DRAFT_846320 [Suillus subalutaceus]|uniref:uncharacterized protein n=1 Tax=Suillus subalutaceus TaxID=48586 RepID=UPI001B870C7C|nr:uncharacterized protein DFJ58DRAFT_846320 [Suillus subalutaceus]KAG1837783.1 hypothetical protein DFJ58DRAFT_846320 [Suillus subalutaceus]